MSIMILELEKHTMTKTIAFNLKIILDIPMSNCIVY